MIKQIILKELLAHLKGYRFVIVFLSFFILMGFNHAVMYQNYKDKLSDYNLKFPFGKPIEKKAEPLSIYVTGVNDLIDRVFTLDDMNLIDLHLVNIDIFRQYFPLIDFNYLTRVILSILAMVVGFDAVCGEKQQGTLKLLLSNSVPRKIIVWGKLLGGLITIIIPFLFTLVFYYVILVLQPDIHFSTSDNLRLLFMILMSILYLSIFLIISIAVSASSETGKVSIIKNFIIWLAVIFIIPNLFSLLAKNRANLPDGRQISDTYLIDYFENQKHLPDSVAREKAYFNYSSNVLEYRNKLKKQIDAIEWSSYIIPSNAYNLAVTSLGNCGLENEGHLRMAILRYNSERLYKKTNSDFEYISLGLGSGINASLKYFLSMILFAAVMLIIMVNRFNKYDIR